MIGNPFPLENFRGGVKWCSNNGWMLTDMFFVLSGFTFVLAYKEKIEDGLINFNFFLENRIKRLFPMMILSTIIMTTMEYVYYYFTNSWWLSEANIWNVFISIIGMPTGWFNMGFIVNMPIWYISILLQAYILAYILVKTVKKTNISIIYIFPIIFYLSLDCSGGTNINFWMLNQFTSRGIKAFFVGLIFAAILNEHQQIIENNKKRLLRFVYILLGVIYLLYKKMGESILGNTLYILVFIIYPCIIFLVLYSDVWNKVCKLKIFQILGKGSFEIYLWNLPIQLGTFLFSIILSCEFHYESKLFFVLHMIISIIISLIIYYKIEIPISIQEVPDTIKFL